MKAKTTPAVKLNQHGRPVKKSQQPTATIQPPVTAAKQPAKKRNNSAVSKKQVIPTSPTVTSSSSSSASDSDLHSSSSSSEDETELALDNIELNDDEDALVSNDVNDASEAENENEAEDDADDEVVLADDEEGDNTGIVPDSSSSEDDDENEDDTSDDDDDDSTPLNNTERLQYYNEDNAGDAHYGEDILETARSIDRKPNARSIKTNDPLNLANLSDSETEANETGNELKYRNRIGNVPLEWYRDSDHLGYTLSGHKMIRKAGGDKLDQWLATYGGENKNWDRTIYDPVNDQHIVLTDHELQMIEQLRKSRFPTGLKPYNEYEDQVEFYTSKLRVESVANNATPPKARFLPSRHEYRMVRRMVTGIRNGWIKTHEQLKAERRAKQEAPREYLLWSTDGNVIQSVRKLSKMPAVLHAPKLPPPSHIESYNPPPEYLPTEEELLQYAVDKSKNPFIGEKFHPRQYAAMRHIPAYRQALRERFERCLDLYLAPRARRKKALPTADQLIPQLPKPADLKPFPTLNTITYKGHTNRIRSISVSPDGQWLVSGSDDGSVRLWETATGRVYKRWQFVNAGEQEERVIEHVAFNPNPVMPCILVAVSCYIFVVPTHTGSDDQNQQMLATLFGTTNDSALAATDSSTLNTRQKNALKSVTWNVTKESRSATVAIASPPRRRQVQPKDAADDEDESKEDHTEGVNDDDDVVPDDQIKGDATEEEIKNLTGVEKTMILRVNAARRTKYVAWHYRGDYFTSVQQIDNNTSSVLIHRLSQHTSQAPFKKSVSLVNAVAFHPNKPFFILLTKIGLRVYNLVTQSLVKKFVARSKWLSSLSIHRSGDHILCGSYDKKVCWFDMDTSELPYRSLRYHTKAVRSVAYHPTYPLFATSSDDGSVHIFHATVYDDLITDPLIVPLKILRAHLPTEATDQLGVLNIHWHPTQPWLFTAGADKLIKLWTC